MNIFNWFKKQSTEQGKLILPDEIIETNTVRGIVLSGELSDLTLKLYINDLQKDRVVQIKADKLRELNKNFSNEFMTNFKYLGDSYVNKLLLDGKDLFKGQLEITNQSLQVSVS